MPEYAFDNAMPAQAERLRTLEALLDAGTIAVLEARGVQRGWDCLEVGAGGGSIALWLSDRARSVLATDLDTTHLTELSRPNLSVRRHDLLADELPESAFDLIHLRLVLAWLADRAEALRRLRAALRPGGRLVVEEMDFVAAVSDPRVAAPARSLFARVLDAHNVALREESGFDCFYGRRLEGDVEAAGFVEVGAAGRAAMWRGGEAGGRIWAQSIAQLRAPIVARGLADDTEVDAALALFADPSFRAVSPLVMAVWARRG